jgi:hypothetical protein
VFSGIVQDCLYCFKHFKTIVDCIVEHCFKHCFIVFCIVLSILKSLLGIVIGVHCYCCPLLLLSLVFVVHCYCRLKILYSFITILLVQKFSDAGEDMTSGWGRDEWLGTSR